MQNEVIQITYGLSLVLPPGSVRDRVEFAERMDRSLTASEKGRQKLKEIVNHNLDLDLIFDVLFEPGAPEERF